MKKSATKPRPYLADKILIGGIGILLSIVLHELFHIVLHWGEITNVSLFRNGSIAEIIVIEHGGYDLEGEEIAAYLITLLVMIVTVIAIYRVSDTSDTRTVRQILFPAEGGKEQMRAAEFQKLVNKTDLIDPDAIPLPKKKKGK